MVCNTSEPHMARRFFPCFDEPSFKAKFKLQVRVRHKSHTAISNTLVEKVIEDETGKWVVFEETPLMSTYLFSFALGKFEKIEMKSGDITI